MHVQGFWSEARGSGANSKENGSWKILAWVTRPAHPPHLPSVGGWQPVQPSLAAHLPSVLEGSQDSPSQGLKLTQEETQERKRFAPGYRPRGWQLQLWVKGPPDPGPVLLPARQETAYQGWHRIPKKSSDLSSLSCAPTRPRPQCTPAGGQGRHGTQPPRSRGTRLFLRP